MLDESKHEAILQWLEIHGITRMQLPIWLPIATDLHMEDFIRGMLLCDYQNDQVLLLKTQQNRFVHNSEPNGHYPPMLNGPP